MKRKKPILLPHSFIHSEPFLSPSGIYIHIHSLTSPPLSLSLLNHFSMPFHSSNSPATSLSTPSFVSFHFLSHSLSTSVLLYQISLWSSPLTTSSIPPCEHPPSNTAPISPPEFPCKPNSPNLFFSHLPLPFVLFLFVFFLSFLYGTSTLPTPTPPPPTATTAAAATYKWRQQQHQQHK